VPLDRPTPPPDKPTPTTPPAPDAPPDPDPWNVAHLTRTQAFESLREKVAQYDAVPERGESEPPLEKKPDEPPEDRAEHDFGESGNDHRDTLQAPALVDEPDQSRYYWAETPHFAEQWRGHRERWPERPSEGAKWVLGPDQSKEAADAIGQIAAVERTISTDIKSVETDSNPRGWLEGFSFRLKGQERLQEKIASAYETSSPDATIGEIAGHIPDAIRYTFCFSEHDYTAGYSGVKEGLEDRGYHMYKSKNSWDDPEYKGINTRWITAEGQRFEVQFHTPESFHAKHQVTHEAYERIRDPGTSNVERRELSIFQREVSSWIPMPDGVSGIADHSEEGF
jgi:hypothetical protein